MLATKYKDGNQIIITEEYLLDFIKKNEELSSKLHEFRGFWKINIYPFSCIKSHL